MNSRLAIGTAQFGLPYGVSNKKGRVSQNTAREILLRAAAAGMDTIDTAISYGDSEVCLGNIGVEDWKVISKLPTLPPNCQEVEDWVQYQIRGSLGRLKIDNLDGLLLHRPSELLEPNGQRLWSVLQKEKENGLIKKIGFSIYAPDELDRLWPSFAPDLVQAPYNLIDRRIETSGWLMRLHDAGIEVHVRSVFLQGLLLLSKIQRPKQFERWAGLWEELEQWLRDQLLTPLQACLAFSLQDLRIDRVIVGVENPQQLEEILSVSSAHQPHPPQTLSVGDLDLIHPSRWSLL
ncbi:MAG: aldo/keto reductase [Desulfobacteraceae bacterium]|nr:aldo/keto reductase [Desulfobacteraceae bacterium]